MTPVIEARHRLHEIPLSLVRDQKAGSVVGRMALAGGEGGLSNAQYEAAQQFLRDHAAFSAAIDAPRGLGAVDLNAVRGRSPGADDVERDHRARAKWKAVQEAVQQCADQHRGANLFAALDYLVIRDEYHAHMVGDLRIALNALKRHYKLAEKLEPAA